ncbi:MAG: D-alanyl-D-alanine carboxypeptidase [candidate division WOR-3 bacterium]|nr:D-alanyl-D-alanine carboxypeptidase [candidate division WOR-3 bacterium]
MLLVLILALAFVPFNADTPVPPPPRPTAVPVYRFDLKPGLDAQVRTYGSAGWRTGIAIYSCSRDSLLYDLGAYLPLSPASNQKLLVTACALEHWDSSFVRVLDARLDSTDLRAHLHRANRKFVDSLGLNARPDFPGYRHLVLADRESDNSEAEWMLEILSRDHATDASRLISSFLDERGVNHPSLRIWDGCGLSHRNRTTAGTLAGLLVTVYESKWRDLFISTLAVPGRPGTLIRRNLDVGPHVAAKTGYINGVFSLSGFLFGQTDTFAFSFIVNGCGSGTRAYELFNSLLNTVYNWDAGETAIAPAAGFVTDANTKQN